MNSPEVSVIIPTIDEAGAIAASIQSAWEGGAAEVIVSDGGSSDATRDVARDNGAVVIQSLPGRGVQLRRGAEHARHPLMLFLHADNCLDADCLNQLIQLSQRLENADALWGAFRQRIDSSRWIYRLIEHGNAARVRFLGMPYGDQAIFVTRSLYDQVGGFGELPLMEDVDLSRRLRRVTWPTLMPARVSVDARRWQERGALRQTLHNWSIRLAHACGVSEQRLARWYK